MALVTDFDRHMNRQTRTRTPVVPSISRCGFVRHNFVGLCRSCFVRHTLWKCTPVCEDEERKLLAKKTPPARSREEPRKKLYESECDLDSQLNAARASP